MKSLMIPFNRLHETVCPFCHSLGTEYHPNLRWGRCHECGRSWTFPPYKRPLNDWNPALRANGQGEG